MHIITCPIYIIGILIHQGLKMQRLLHGKKRANKVCSGRVGFVAIFKHFSGFEFFLLSNIFHARPHATNANR